MDAIAWTLGVRVHYEPLDGCEALIVGNDECAIATVNSRCSRRRQRFSLGHELGHWKHHRNQLLVCREEDIGSRAPKQLRAESIADAYAADLLMPRYIFEPAAHSFSKLNFTTVRALAEIFDTSLTATAIRLIETVGPSAMLVCHGPKGRKWFVRSQAVPTRWFPQEQLDAESFALDVLYNRRAEDPMPRKIGADAWFDRSEARRYEVREQTVRIGQEEILTLVFVDDDQMLTEQD